MLQLSSTALYCGRASPQQLRHCGGGGHLRERNLCGGFCSFFFWRQREAGLAVFVGRAKGDAPDRAHGDDQLSLLHAQREEAEAGLARERAQRKPLTVRELDLDVRALRRMRRRVLLNLAV